MNVYFIKWFQWWKIYNVFFFLKQIHVFVYVINSSFYGTNQNSVLFWQESENILCNININFATICYENAMTALMCKRIETLMTMIMMVFMKWITFQSCKVNGKVNDIKLRFNYFFRSFNWEKTFDLSRGRLNLSPNCFPNYAGHKPFKVSFLLKNIWI